LSDLFPGPAWPSRTFFGPGKRDLTAHVRRRSRPAPGGMCCRSHRPARTPLPTGLVLAPARRTPGRSWCCSQRPVPAAHVAAFRSTDWSRAGRDSQRPLRPPSRSATKCSAQATSPPPGGNGPAR